MNTHCATFIIFLLLNFGLSASDKIQLRPDWEIGKVYQQETTTEMIFKNPDLLDSGNQKTIFTQTLSVAVSQDDGANQKVAEVNITSLKGSMDLMGQTVSYDSANPAQSPPFLQQAFGSLAGRSFSLVYDQNNNFVETRIAESPSAAATPLGSGKGMSGQQLADAFRKSQDIPLPKSPISVGETWRYQDKIEMPPLGIITIEVSGKFEAIVEEGGHRQAKLLIEGVFQFPQNDSAVIRFGSGSKFTGEIFFDLDRRLVSRSSMNSTISVLADGRAAPLTQSVKSKLTSIANAAQK
ncbi:MAG: hypothetical protein RL693_2579 [Verrucomicrobiota bacterium]|jgi:hypothetical protein